MQRVSFRARLSRFALAALLVPAAAQPQTPPQTPGITGVWQIETPVAALKTADGKTPPLRPKAAATYQAHIAARARGDTSYDSATWCASVGMPRAMLINYPFEIIARPGHVAFLHEWNWWARTVYLDGALGDQPRGGEGFAVDGGFQQGRVEASDPEGPMGLSKGRWDGETLVIETDHLRASTLLDNSGLPHGEGLKITERLRLLTPDRLEDRITIDDPATYAAKWDALVTYRRSNHEIVEDVCLDRVKAGEPAVRE